MKLPEVQNIAFLLCLVIELSDINRTHKHTHTPKYQFYHIFSTNAILPLSLRVRESKKQLRTETTGYCY